MASLPVQGWDYEARERAMQQARAYANKDPAAAEMILAQLQVEEQAAMEAKPDPLATVLHKVYEPSKMYSRIAKFYGWPYREIDEMDYVAFFGCVEDAKEIQEEENRSYNNGSSSNDIVTEHEVQAWMPPARKYEGPTVDAR